MLVQACGFLLIELDDFAVLDLDSDAVRIKRPAFS